MPRTSIDTWVASRSYHLFFINQGQTEWPFCPRWWHMECNLEPSPGLKLNSTQQTLNASGYRPSRTSRSSCKSPRLPTRPGEARHATGPRRPCPRATDSPYPRPSYEGPDEGPWMQNERHTCAERPPKNPERPNDRTTERPEKPNTKL